METTIWTKSTSERTLVAGQKYIVIVENDDQSLETVLGAYCGFTCEPDGTNVILTFGTRGVELSRIIDVVEDNRP